ncbi:MAG: cytochrome c biogenesis protein ResB [Planctomycetota bacterium]
MRSVLLGTLLELRSRVLAVALITILALLCVAGTFIPQEGEESYDEWQRDNPLLASLVGSLGVDEMFTSFPFVVLVAAVGLSTSVCTASRLGGLGKSVDALRAGQLASGSAGARPGAGQDKSRREGGPAADIRSTGDPRKASPSLPRRLLSRHRRLGSVVFHLGIVLTLAGALVSSLTRCEGSVVVGEGQTVPLKESSFTGFVRRWPLLDDSPLFRVRLEKFRPEHVTRWGVPDYASDVTVIDGGQERKKTTVRVNSPLVYRGVTLYQVNHGFSPRFMFAVRKSARLFDKYVPLGTDLDSDPVRYWGSFPVAGTEFTVDAELFPDAVFEEGRLRSKSPVPRNPAASVTVRRGDKVVFSGPIARGRPVEIEKGVCIGLGRPKYWSKFNVVKDRGVTFVFIGAWIATAGLCIRFLPLKRKRAA